MELLALLSQKREVSPLPRRIMLVGNSSASESCVLGGTTESHPASGDGQHFV